MRYLGTALRRMDERGRNDGRNTKQEGRKRSRPISRVLSWTTIHLRYASPRTSSDLPGSTCGPHARLSPKTVRLPPYLVLLRAGFTVPPSVATGAVRSYRTISPLPARTPKDARLGGLLSVALSVGSRPPGVTWRLALGARTFLHACAQRLSGRLRRESYPCNALTMGISVNTTMAASQTAANRARPQNCPQLPTLQRGRCLGP